MSYTTQIGVAAAIVDSPGAEPRLGSVVLPARTSRTTLVRVIAAPLNPLDLVIASGTFHSARHEAPYVPGSECVGTVLESDRYAPGSLVYAECHASPSNPGSFAAQVLVADEDLLPLPDGLDPVLAAAVGNSGTAAFMPLVEDGRLRPGETVLVLGATGAVGQLAIQVAQPPRRGPGDRRRPRRRGAGAATLARRGCRGRAAGRRGQRGAGGPAAGGGRAGRRRSRRSVRGGRWRRRCGSAPSGRGWSTSATRPAPSRRYRPGCCAASSSRCPGFAGLHTPLRDKRAALTWLWTALAGGELQLEVRTFSLRRNPRRRGGRRRPRRTPSASSVFGSEPT